MHLASLDIGGTYIKYGVVSFEPHSQVCSIVWHERVPTLADDGLDAMLTRIRDIVAQITRRSPEIATIGVGVPGVVDPTTHHVHNPPNLPGWVDVDLAGYICQSPLPIPSTRVFVENDANCGAIAELRAGAGKGLNDFVYVTLGTGVGGGLVLGGRLYAGSHGEAGEIGHMLYGPAGILEEVVGRKGIMAMYGEANTDVHEISRRADAGDEHAIEVLTGAGILLGQALCSALVVLGVRTVIVGGGVGKSRVLFEATERTLAEVRIQTIAENVKLLPAYFVDHSGLIGAALLGVE